MAVAIFVRGRAPGLRGRRRREGRGRGRLVTINELRALIGRRPGGAPASASGRAAHRLTRGLGGLGGPGGRDGGSAGGPESGPSAWRGDFRGPLAQSLRFPEPPGGGRRSVAEEAGLKACGLLRALL